MKISVFILEDNPITAQDLKEILESQNIAVVGTAYSVEEAFKKLDGVNPDVFLVDIKLKGQLTGIDFAEKIKSTRRTPLIFITANSDSETVKKAITTQPSSFLTKPFDDQDVVIAVELAFSKHNEIQDSTIGSHKVPNHLFLKDGSQFEKVELNDIRYLEAEGSYCKVFTSEKQFLLTSNLNAFLQNLNGSFVRIHRSFAVNPNKITKLDADHVFLEGKMLPIGRSHKADLKDIFVRFS